MTLFLALAIAGGAAAGSDLVVPVPEGPAMTEPPPASDIPVPAVAAAVIRPQPAMRLLHEAALRQVKRKIRASRKNTWHWQSLMGLPRMESSYSAAGTRSLPYSRWVLALWQKRAKRMHVTANRWMRERIAAYQAEVRHWQLVMGAQSLRVLASSGTLETRYRQWKQRAYKIRDAAANPPRLSAWNCIHRYEGSWRDTGGPYYGGLQMDLTFQRSYGAYLLRTKGTADRWTPLEQIWVAEKAYRSGRGFHPWPNTARACGLL